MQAKRLSAYQFEFRPYQRPFKRPLSTHYGNWEIREGIILRLSDETGRVGWGEIAPIPWFGSETLKQALDFCQQLPPKITAKDVFSIPTELSACQFGFESAWEWRDGEMGREGDGERGGDGNSQFSDLNFQSKIKNTQSKITYSYLLPTGEAALQAWQTPWNRGNRTFKWKIGVAPLADELNLFNQLIQSLPASVQLRLDANGGLTQQEAHQWLQAADKAGIIEFLEQPLSPEHFDILLEMSRQYATPIALDESVATLNQLEDCYQKGWRGIFVIKAAIAGSPKRLRQFCQEHAIDAVFSSVFETAIAKQAALQLAAELSYPNRAVGFGVNHWFTQDDQTFLTWLWNNH
ncbi:MAG TPA: o-succinylbenzoate synthase [Coleofasciculaceae cyanobacterium]